MAHLDDNNLSKKVDALLQFINTLPLKEPGKIYLRGKVIVDVYDIWHFDDENNSYSFEEFIADPENPKYDGVKATYGIDNEAQWNRYLNTFVENIKKVRNQAVIKYFDGLDSLSPQEKVVSLSNQLEKFSKAELFNKHGIKEIKDPVWHNQLKEILGTQIQFAKEQSEYITASNLPITEENPNNELFIVEEIENKIAFEGVRYKRECEDFWQTKTFNPSYMGSYIENDLVKFIQNFLYEKLRPLNNFERNKYLIFSAKQFETHTPPKRFKAFRYKFHDAYWHPNPMPFKENETWMFRYSNHYWKHYTLKFDLLKSTFMKVYNDFYEDKPSNQPMYVNTCLNNFLKDLYYTYPLYNSPVSFYYQWQNNLKALQQEVLENLILLPQESKQPYLDKILIQLQDLYKDAVTSKDVYDEMFTKYSTTIDDVLRQGDLSNPLVKILNSDPPNFHQTLEPEFHPQTINLQTDFYNYHYGLVISSAIEFINAQVNKTMNVVVFNNQNEGNRIEFIIAFDNILSSSKQSYLLELLEDLGITVNGKSVLTERKKSALRGVAEALLEANFLPAFSLEKSYRMLAEKIGAEIKSKLDFTNTSQEFKSKTERYLKNNPPE